MIKNWPFDPTLKKAFWISAWSEALLQKDWPLPLIIDKSPGHWTEKATSLTFLSRVQTSFSRALSAMQFRFRFNTVDLIPVASVSCTTVPVWVKRKSSFVDTFRSVPVSEMVEVRSNRFRASESPLFLTRITLLLFLSVVSKLETQKLETKADSASLQSMVKAARVVWPSASSFFASKTSLSV